MTLSKDGSILAYSISEGGSDWRKVIIMNTLSKKIVEDTLVDVKIQRTVLERKRRFFLFQLRQTQRQSIIG